MTNTFSYINNANPAYVDDLYQQYQHNPDALDDDWRRFFEGYEFSKLPSDHKVLDSLGSHASVHAKEIAVAKLIQAYRSRGHLIAKTNPIRQRRLHKADLDLDYFGLSAEDLNTTFEAGADIGLPLATLREIVDHLKQTYCESIGVEFMYSQDPTLRQWVCNRIDPIANRPNYDADQKKSILAQVAKAVAFESFLHTKYVGQKRFSLEGAESVIPGLEAAIEQAAQYGAKEIVVGMAHRGRLNVLTAVFGKTYKRIFREFDGKSIDPTMGGDGDVKYHLGYSTDRPTQAGHDVHLSLIPNPSHLEAVNGVVQGVVYAKRKNSEANDGHASYADVVPILIHGDAALAGQGVNYEVTNMSKLDGYDNGGTVHVVINNQLGYTTSYLEGRSSVYCTDLAKITESPVFHVSADDPIAVVHAMQMAIAIRYEFKIDVYVDILGYRRYGHNEGDEPRFTQPVMYDIIKKHDNVYSLFAQALQAQGVVDAAYCDQLITDMKTHLQSELDAARAEKKPLSVDTFKGQWTQLRMPSDSDFDQSVDTRVSKKKLDAVMTALTRIDDDFPLFSKTKKIIESRKKMYANGSVDWAVAEQLAYGTLLADGHAVRLSGQDAQRGTFSHRHSVLKHETEEVPYIPLNHIHEKQAPFTVYNSMLSEYCVLGFELGCSWAQPNNLIVWEAQFGDFANGAQIVIDQFLSSSASKWHRWSGLTLLLPHGYEGMGPEHSSARLERFLQLCGEHNMYVINSTTPANIFHALRRQIENPFRIPMVVMSPKSLLRHPDVVSSVESLTEGRFQEVIDDSIPTPNEIKRVVLCSGKLYYDLKDYREANGIQSVAVIRLEQLYPFPEKALHAIKKRYQSAKSWVWAQEEPKNMGAWWYLSQSLTTVIQSVECVARKVSASPAAGNAKTHAKEQNQLIESAFKGV
ncbi:2-oxoglutarate dehydrogenase E1 component [bacterium]|nr:2-oxoglutarate dehydrogenase E1 component [bacterium]